MNTARVLAAFAAGACTAVVEKQTIAHRFLNRLHGATVLITGGPRGLGLALTRRALYHGANVAICSRDPRELVVAKRRLQKEFPEGNVLTGRCDVTKEEDTREFVAQVIDTFGFVDVLINNAGVIQVGPWSTMTSKDYEESLAVHFWGSFNMLRAAWDSSQERRGHVINITSIGGRISIPHLLPYSVGKFALVGFSEGLATELAAEGVSVTTVTPGLMRTGGPHNAWFKGQHRKEYAWFSISDSLPLVSIDADAAARRILIAGMQGKRSLVFPLSTKLPVLVHGVCPGFTVAVLSVVNRLLPDVGGVGRRRVRGNKSSSGWSPSLLTVLTDRAAIRNNEKR